MNQTLATPASSLAEPPRTDFWVLSAATIVSLSLVLKIVGIVALIVNVLVLSVVAVVTRGRVRAPVRAGMVAG